MHFYIVDGNFYLRRWLHMPPTWQVPSSLSDLCMDSIIIPNFQNETAEKSGPIFLWVTLSLIPYAPLPDCSNWVREGNRIPIHTRVIIISHPLL